MSKLTDYIGSQFGKPTGIVGRICCLGMNIINKKMYNTVVDQLLDEKSILEIGYGNGFMTRKMYQKTKAKISGIDISKDMLITASKKNRVGIAMGDITLEIGDCCELKYENQSFDVVATVNTIYFWSDPIKGLTEIRRVLRTGGKFYNVVYAKEWMSKSEAMNVGKKMYTKEEYINMGKKVGFFHVEIIDIIENTNFMIVYRK